MDVQFLINFAGGLIIAAMGWWCREIWDSVKSLKKDLKDLEVELPKEYVRKEDIETRLDKIDAVLERIFDKLDSKVDK
jgi:hypothetical protein